MKKIYVFFLLAANVISLSATEKPRPHWPCITPTGHPLVIFTQNPYAQPGHTDAHPDVNNQQSYEQIVNTNWQKYNEIMDMPYKRDQPVATTNEAQLLTPVYQKQQSKSTEQEKKPLLRTNSLLPDENMMQSLYNKSCRIVGSEYRNKRLEQKYQNKKYVRLIEHMNNAKNSGIHEDSMGRFAYNKKEVWTINDIDMTPFYSLFFSLLKKYNLTVHETGEQLPLHFGAKKTRLKDILTTSSDTNKQIVASNTTHTHNDFLTYPAFFQLTCALRHAMQELDAESVKIFTTYLYENDGILLQDYSQGSYVGFKNEFYTHAYNMLLHNGNTYDLYHLIQMIDKAKNVGNIHNEDDLATSIIGFDPFPSFTELFCRFFDSKHSPENIRQYISLFCALVKKYNNARLTKITPTATQYKAFTVQKELDIAAVHESLCNNALFDENRYAFAEFKELLESTELLKYESENKVNQHFDTLYSPKKLELEPITLIKK